MSILTIPYLRFFPKWFQNLITPKVRVTNLLIEYSHSQGATKEKTITIEYLDVNDNVVSSEILIDNQQGGSHKVEIAPLSKFRIKVENTSNVTLNFNLKLNHYKIGSINEFVAMGISSSAVKYSKIYKIVNDDFSFKKVFRIKELFKLSTGKTFTSDAQTTKNDITSILVDEKENIYVGRIANSLYANSLEKYNPKGELIWGKLAIKSTIATGTITGIVKDSDGFIYTVDSLGSICKNDSIGSDAIWRVSLGQPCSDVKIDQNGDIYVSGGVLLRKYNNKGEILWTYTFAGSGVQGLELYDGFIYIATKFANQVHKLNQTNANETTPPTVEWDVDLVSAPASIHIQDGKMYVRTNTGTRQRFLIGNIETTGVTLGIFDLSAGDYGRILPDKFNGYFVITRGASNQFRRYNESNEIVYKIELTDIGTSLGNAITKNSNGEIYYSDWGNITKINPDQEHTGFLTK